MNTKWSGPLTLIIFVVITIIGFFSWLAFLTLVWLFLQAVGVPTDLWAMIEALSTAVAAAAVLSAGFIAYRELSEVTNSRYLEVADRLFDELNSTESIEARRWIFQNLPYDPQQGLDTLSDEGRAAAKRVLNSLDRVSFLTQSGWIPDEVVMPWMHPMIAKSWEKLGPYVLYERERRQEPYYYEQASLLAERCRIWRQKHLEDIQVNWVDKAL
jgi:hypothetical protein